MKLKQLLICLLAALMMAACCSCGQVVDVILDEVENQLAEQDDTRESEETDEPEEDDADEEAEEAAEPGDLTQSEGSQSIIVEADPTVVEAFDIDPSEYPPEEGTYSSMEDVALYLYVYGHLPDNFMTKKEAQQLGWNGGSLERYAPGMCIGGSYFGNYEGVLPEGHEYHECDIDTLGASSRGAKRIVWSEEGQIYYTEDHYETFVLLYGEEE